MTEPTTKLTPGYVSFKNRRWDFRGDKDTWAKVSDDRKSLTVKYARHGTVSSDYYDEFASFCSDHGIDFDELRKQSGKAVTVSLG